MAKLNVVIPSVDVEVDGVKYRKVERKAQAGDIVKALADKTDIDAESFYEVVKGARGDNCFVDNGGDKRYIQLTAYSCHYEVYEKVTEPIAAPPTPVKYREVKRKANVGERIKIVAAEGTFGKYDNGDVFVVDRRNDIGVDVDAVRTTHSGNDDGFIDDEEYVVLEPITEPSVLNAPTLPERLQVGEYAKVIDVITIDGDVRSSIHIGEIRIITVDDGTRAPFSCAKLDGSDYDWFREEALVRATDAEVASAKQALERTKAIGEFAEGGYAVVVNAIVNDNATRSGINGNYVTTEIVTNGGRCALKLTNPDGKLGGYCNADALRKITKEEYEAATNPAPKFEVGEKVRLISGGGRESLHGYETDGIYTVVEPVSSFGNGKVVITGGVQSVGYAKPDQLEKVSIEEIAKLVDEQKWNAIGRKVGEYKAGDVVRVIKACWIADTKVGDITTISELRRGGVALTQLNSSDVNAWVYADDLELIAPVESLFNVTTAGGERK